METKIEPGMEMGGYRIESLLGRGGMAEVYKAWNTGLHRHEALKILPPQMTFDQSFVERFLNEARMAAKLHHPHIATIHMVSAATTSQPYFAMEMVEGGDLSDLLHQRGKLPLAESLPILRQIASALDYAHRQGIIHRDVKPANVLLQGDTDDTYVIKVVDFGIARAQEAGDGARLTKTGMIVGTPEYMSPEQGGSSAKVSPHSDQYSLAVIAYEMICGQPPFSAGSEGTALTLIMKHLRDQPRPPVEYSPHLPLSANNVILRALSKEPDERYSTCTDFVKALEFPVDVALIVPGKSSSGSKNDQPRRLMPVIMGLTLLLGVILIGIGLNRRNNPANFVHVLVKQNTLSDTTPVAKLPLSNQKSNVPGNLVPLATNSLTLTKMAVSSVLTQWLAFQNERQVSEYASLYTADFVGIKRTSGGKQKTYGRADWIKDRGRMLTATKNLNISITNQQVSLHGSWAEASFNQYFRTARYGDWGPKVIKIRSTPIGLKIFREELLASYPLR